MDHKSYKEAVIKEALSEFDYSSTKKHSMPNSVKLIFTY
jgi:hypothetical protein